MVKAKSLSKGVIQNGRIAARNGIGQEYAFVVILAGFVKLIRPIIIEWIKARGGRKIEVQKGDIRVSASTLKEMDAIFALLEKHEKCGVIITDDESVGDAE